MLPASHSKVLLLGSLDTTKNVLSIFLNTILFYLLVLQFPLSCSFSINAHQDNKTIKDVVAKQCIGMYSLGYKMFKHSMHVLSCTQTKIVKNVTPPKAMNIYKKYLTNKPTSCSDPNSYNFCTDCRRFFCMIGCHNTRALPAEFEHPVCWSDYQGSSGRDRIGSCVA